MPRGSPGAISGGTKPPVSSLLSPAPCVLQQPRAPLKKKGHQAQKTPGAGFALLLFQHYLQAQKSPGELVSPATFEASCIRASFVGAS